MKKFALYTFLSLSSVLVAQDVMKYEITPTIGYNTFDNKSKMEDSFFYGIRATMHPNSYYGYRLSYERSDNVHYDKSSTKKTTNVDRISGQILINGEEEYQVIPYVLLGGGYEILSDETTHDVSQGYVEGGIGFKYHMKNNLIFDLEGKVLKKFDTDDIDYMMTFGLGYLFDPSIKEPEFYTPRAVAKMPKVNTKTPLTTNFVKKEVIKPVETIKPIATDKIEAKYTFKEENSKRAPEIIESIVSKPMIAPTTEKYVVDNQYFVQVAAWFDSEDAKLLDKLSNGGFSYNIENAIRHGKEAELVKVGPYEHISDAKVALKRLKKIKRDAFITK